jgi:septal ring factor EnvC (AmiA/AmiB activator)
MLVTFKSKAAGNLYMFEENARQILDLLDKDVRQGIITAEQTGKAIRVLEEEIARQKIEEAREKEEREREEREAEERRFYGENEEAEKEKEYLREKTRPEKAEVPVPFSARAYPFLQMLKAAHKKEKDIVWGV